MGVLINNSYYHCYLFSIVIKRTYCQNFIKEQMKITCKEAGMGSLQLFFKILSKAPSVVYREGTAWQKRPRSSSFLFLIVLSWQCISVSILHSNKNFKTVVIKHMPSSFHTFWLLVSLRRIKAFNYSFKSVFKVRCI